MATKETDLERQKREAAELGEFERWKQAYSQEQAVDDEWGGGLINGVPSAVAVDASQVESQQMNPQGGAVNPDTAYLAAERIAAQGDIARRKAVAPKVNRSYDPSLFRQRCVAPLRPSASSRASTDSWTDTRDRLPCERQLSFP